MLTPTGPWTSETIQALFASNPAFCVLPWLNVSASVDGKFARCSLDHSLFDQLEVFTAAEKPVLPLAADALGCNRGSPFAADNPDRVYGLRSVFNAPNLRQTRLSMLAATKVTACRLCHQLEAQNCSSMRQHSNALYRDQLDWAALLNGTDPAGHVATDPLLLDLRLGNACNLQCQMCCYPTSSALHRKHPEAWLQGILDPYADDPVFWTDLEALAPQVQRLHLAGGEPFLQKSHPRLLQLLVGSGAAAHIDLFYTTNLTVLPPAATEAWKAFRSVTVGASCDGTGAVFESIRRGAKWEVFVRNALEAQRHAKVYLCVTVQKDNIGFLGALFDWAASVNLPVNLENVLQWPAEMRLQTLSAAELNSCHGTYAQSAVQFRAEGHPELANQIERLCAVLESAGRSANQA